MFLSSDVNGDKKHLLGANHETVKEGVQTATHFDAAGQIFVEAISSKKVGRKVQKYLGR